MDPPTNPAHNAHNAPETSAPETTISYADEPFNQASYGDVYICSQDESRLHKTLASEVGLLLEDERTYALLSEDTKQRLVQDGIHVYCAPYSPPTLLALLCVFTERSLPQFSSLSALSELIKACVRYDLRFTLQVVGETQFSDFVDSEPAECFVLAFNVSWNYGATVAGSVLRQIPLETLRNDTSSVLRRPENSDAWAAYLDYWRRCRNAGQGVIVEDDGGVYVCGLVLETKLQDELCNHHQQYGKWSDPNVTGRQHPGAPAVLVPLFRHLRQQIALCAAKTPELQDATVPVTARAMLECNRVGSIAGLNTFLLDTTRRTLELMEDAMDQVQVFENGDAISW